MSTTNRATLHANILKQVEAIQTAFEDMASPLCNAHGLSMLLSADAAAAALPQERSRKIADSSLRSTVVELIADAEKRSDLIAEMLLNLVDSLRNHSSEAQAA